MKIEEIVEMLRERWKQVYPQLILYKSEEVEGCVLCGMNGEKLADEIEKSISTIRREAVGSFEKWITERLKIVEDELTRCNNDNSTSFAEDGGEALVGQINAYEELLNYLKENQ